MKLKEEIKKVYVYDVEIGNMHGTLDNTNGGREADNFKINISGKEKK